VKFHAPVLVPPPASLTPTPDDFELLRRAFVRRSHLEGRSFALPIAGSPLRLKWSNVGFREVVVLVDALNVRTLMSVGAANRFDPERNLTRYRPTAAEALWQLLHPGDRALVVSPSELAGWRDRAELTAHPSAAVSGLMLVDVGLVAATDPRLGWGPATYARSLETDVAQRAALPAAADPAPDPYAFMAARRRPAPDPARAARDAAVGRAVGARPGRFGLALPG